MILRKPYAFLIKHFKLIHLILVVLFVFISYKSNNLVTFLTRYIKNEQTYNIFDNLQSIYTGFSFYMAILLSLIIGTIVLLLMHNKNKPKRFYIFFVTYLLLLAVTLLLTSSMLGELQYFAIDLRYAKAIKDIMTGMYYVQYIFIPVLIVRASGFNIKRFDFAKDIDALDISEKDNEEFEVELNLDTEDIRAKIRKRLRYMKYTYIENKLVFNSLISLILVITVIVTAVLKLNNETIYSEGKSFKTNSFEIKVINSYKTKYNYRKEKISNDKFYLIVNAEFKNITNINKKLDINNTRIKLDQYNVVNPITNKYKDFSDFGSPYYGTNIKPQEKVNLILVYEVDNKYYDNDLEFQCLVGLTVKDNKNIFNYKRVAINPNDYDKNSEKLIETIDNNNLLTFNNSILDDVSIKINKVEFNNKYKYNFTKCTNGKCSKSTATILPTYNVASNQTIMKINYELNLGNKINLSYINDKFIEYFGYIRYTYKGKTYEANTILKDITPYSVKDYAYIEVPDRVYIADEVFLVFKIRDKIYSYKIYEKKVE